MDDSLIRPRPIISTAAKAVDASTPPADSAARLVAGEWLMVSDTFGAGVAILEALTRLMKAPPDDASYQIRQTYRRKYARVSERLLVQIVDHRLVLTKAPWIGFLGELYPELETFALPFVKVQALNRAWEWYKEGVHLAVLGHRVHPFYGTYAPTRTIHIELFATWLSQFKGSRNQAIDVGTGCGVLALMLCKAGFEHVLATDINPNAIESVGREIARLAEPPPIIVHHGDLLGPQTAPADLIVFNPPWVRGDVANPLDRALYFEDGLFERFFDQAVGRLASGGRVVIVFSNLIELVQPNIAHPIRTELYRGRFKEVQKLSRKVKSTPGNDGRRRITRERVEVWELEKA